MPTRSQKGKGARRRNNPDIGLAEAGYQEVFSARRSGEEVRVPA